MSSLTVQKMMPASLCKVMVIKGDEKLTLYYILKSVWPDGVVAYNFVNTFSVD